MKQLPTEIWHEILQLLAEQDKLTCLLVSRYWNKSIRFHLLKHAKIRNDIDLNNAIAYFEKYPELANNVLHLEIKMCKNIILYLPRVQQLFRNLEILEWCSGKKLQVARYPLLYPWSFDAWNNLKELRISEPLNYSFSAMFEIILGSTCPNLTKLSLEIMDYVQELTAFYNLEEDRCALSARLLENAPQLSHLEITSFHSTLSSLEIIHKSLPNLKSLKLPNLWICQYDIPNYPVEKVQLDDLYLDINLDIDTLVVFRYIVEKYTGLKSFQMIIQDDAEIYHTPAAELEAITLPLFARCPQLTHYDQFHFPFTQAVADQMDRCGIQLKTIKLYVNQQTVEPQCTALRDSNQSKFINHVYLRLQNMEQTETVDQELDAHLIPQALELLANLSNMTKLTLHSNDSLLCFQEFPIFLNRLPHLLTLSIQDMTLTTTHGNFANQLTDLSLKTIEIRNLKTSSNGFAVSVLLSRLLRRCAALEKFLLHISFDESPNNILDSVTLNFTDNTKLKTIDIDSKGNKNQYLITNRNPTYCICCIHDKKKDLLMTGVEFVSMGYFTVIMLSQPVSLNSHRVENP